MEFTVRNHFSYPLEGVQINKENFQPDSLLPSLKSLEFVCPICKGKLLTSRSGYHCDVCERSFKIHDGIPDFRIFDDPYLTYTEDFERTETVLKGLKKYRFKELLEYYWSFSDITPEHLRAKFVRNALLGEERAKRLLKIIAATEAQSGASGKRLIEIGSGTGNLLAVTQTRFAITVGTDIAMRWLHLSRRRFIDIGLPVPPLVCCCAEYLPFPDSSFDIIVAASTMEFVNEPREAFAECSRVLRRNGSMFVNSVNRFSIARDPYSYLWGVGFLPRRIQQSYVRFRNNSTYKIKTFSVFELRRIVGGLFSKIVIALPDADEATLHNVSGFTRFQIKAYRAIKRIRLMSFLLQLIGPGWDVTLKKGRER